jgi:AP-3 complex subunit beta
MLLNRYVFLLARYDVNYDVRDRARVLSSLLLGVAPSILASYDEIIPAEDRGGVVLRNEQVKVVLFNGKANISVGDNTGLFMWCSSYLFVCSY